MQGNRLLSAPVRAPLFEENLAGSYWLVVVERIKAEWNQPQKQGSHRRAVFVRQLRRSGSVLVDRCRRLTWAGCEAAGRFSICSLARREKVLHRFREQPGLTHESHVSALGKHDKFRPRYQCTHRSGQGWITFVVIAHGNERQHFDRRQAVSVSNSTPFVSRKSQTLCTTFACGAISATSAPAAALARSSCGAPRSLSPAACPNRSAR